MVTTELMFDGSQQRGLDREAEKQEVLIRRDGEDKGSLFLIQNVRDDSSTDPGTTQPQTHKRRKIDGLESRIHGKHR